jgi:hypothetical protein
MEQRDYNRADFREISYLEFFIDKVHQFRLWIIAQNNIKYACVISGFCREEDENCNLLGYYAASSGNFLPTFRDKIYIHLQGS